MCRSVSERSVSCEHSEVKSCLLLGDRWDALQPPLRPGLGRTISDKKCMYGCCLWVF